MDDVLLVYVLHALQDLPHVPGAGELRVLEVVVHQALEELPSRDAGGGGPGGERGVTGVGPPRVYLLLQDHHRLRADVVGGQALHQFRVMEEVHELHLPARRRPLLGGPGPVELPGAHLSRLFVRQPEHFAKLPTGREKKHKNTNPDLIPASFLNQGVIFKL